ncbi:MAG TPA: phosphatase PAP2 family protein [Spirillospora sp.]|nr:phosphatase PAP2 family protein [Spirillospora sp.]
MRRTGGTEAILQRDLTGRRLAAATALQVLVMGVVIGAYELGRHFADGRPSDAFAHARWLWDLERTLHLPDEAAFQKWALGWDGWVRAANEYYVRVHFPAILLFMAWMWFRHREGWPRVRAVIAITAAAALALHFAFPLAPPRMLPGHGFIDLMNVYGPSSYSSKPGEGMANQFAAMPSLHVGWALLVAWGAIRYGGGRWRYILALHPVLTFTIVVVTANHYWTDGIVGCTIVVLTLWATSRIPALADRPPERAGVSPRRDSVGA